MSSSPPLPLPLPLPHIAIFPFMSKGHTIPLTHLAHLLHRRRLASAVTFFTTPLNSPSLRRSLAGTAATIVVLPFPSDAPGVPPGVESTDKLTSVSDTFIPFAVALKLLQPHFELALHQAVPPITLLIADPFLFWAKDSAVKFGIPLLAFHGMSNFAWTLQTIVLRANLKDHHQPFAVPGFPGVELTLSDLNQPFTNPQGALLQYHAHVTEAIRESQGMLVNSFYELEAKYCDYWDRHIGPKSWCVGPLCLARTQSDPTEPDLRIQNWLDAKLAMGCHVLYVAFGSQAELSRSQLRELASGLENSGVDFLWVVRSNEVDFLEDGFEDRVVDKGLVVKDWVDQLGILRHESVKGFMSHCGWNSVMEGISVGVPFLAWPMMGEQYMNVKLVVDELKIGLRISNGDGGEEVERMVKELMVGEKGKEVRENAGKWEVEANKAVMDGGSSWVALEKIISELCAVIKD